MSEVSSTRTIRCDNCGATETITFKDHAGTSTFGDLPTLSMNALYFPSGKDYCPACRDAVARAIEETLRTRRRYVSVAGAEEREA